MKGRQHRIDILFPLMLYFVFAVAALSVVMLATEAYKNAVQNSSRNQEAGIALAYVSESIHRSDDGSDVHIGTLDGCDAIVIKKSEDFTGYIYFDNNALKELYVSPGFEPTRDMGTVVTELRDFEFEQVNSSLIRISCVDEDNHEVSTLVALRSR